jgi:uncharacterized protein (TIGR02598 family)
MLSAPRRSGFSLVEVVVAVGIFAIAIVSIIGLLVPINNSVADIRDSEDASRLSTTIQGELQKLSFATLKAVLDTPPVTDANRIFSSRDGNIVEAGRPDSQAPARTNVWDPQNVRTQAEEDALKFFKVELIRNDDLSPAAGDAAAGYLAFTIKLSWPAFAPNGDAIAASNQSVMLIPAAITR